MVVDDENEVSALTLAVAVGDVWQVAGVCLCKETKRPTQLATLVGRLLMP